MAFYLHDTWVEKAKAVIPTNYSVVKSYSHAAYAARRILNGIKPEDIKKEKGVITICSKAHTSDYNRSWKGEWQEVEEEIKKEFKEIFGLDAEVDFHVAYTTEEEPDPIPPLYWGGTDTVYHYNLTIKIKVDE